MKLKSQSNFRGLALKQLIIINYPFTTFPRKRESNLYDMNFNTEINKKRNFQNIENPNPN